SGASTETGITRRLRWLIREGQQMLAPIVSFGAAVGSSPRSSCGRPSATGSPPATAITTLASAVRVQAPASDERSEPCRRRRRGAASVRHGGRSEKASLNRIFSVAVKRGGLYRTESDYKEMRSGPENIAIIPHYSSISSRQ